MKNIIHIKPRQSGKTNSIIERFIENPQDTLILTHNYGIVHRIIKGLRERIGDEWVRDMQKNPQNIYPISFINSYSCFRAKFKHINTILVDEYDFFTSKEKFILQKIKRNEPNITWRIYTTLKQKLCKPLFLDLRGNSTFLKKELEDKYGRENLDYLLNSFYIDHDFEFIVNKLNKYEINKRFEDWGWMDKYKLDLELYNNIWLEPRGYQININIEKIY